MKNHMLVDLLVSLTEDVPFRIANLANAASLLYHSLTDVNWAGFYLRRGDDLVLGPFMGQPACVVIGKGKGVCGAAFERGETLVVPEVEKFSGHIACDSRSKSEIVIPLTVDGERFGVLDIDSPLPDRFSAEDREILEAFARSLETALEACEDSTES